MNQGQLLEFVKQVESFLDGDQWRVVTNLPASGLSDC